MASQPKIVAESASALGGDKLPPAFVADSPATPATPENRVTFVRNIFPNDTIALSNGVKVSFNRYLFTTSDEALIALIDAEGWKQHIIRQ